ncbi:MAG: hypothetical protein E3J94_07295 [Desulfobacteraceae bacterium]|nr:MAG: hypothetical protein E3J94_07050 [Desulfobacteraceae bacterium]TES88959.1 MAG: hypothetical protein E3J94_07295 [Desulfobacteraceae bacterium]
MLEQLVPTAVSTAALGLVFWGIRAQRAEMIKKVDKIEDKYLPVKYHEKLEEIQRLSLKLLITEQIDDLKNVIFPELRAIKDRLPPNAKNKE